MSSDTKGGALIHLLIDAEALLDDFEWSCDDIDAILQINKTLAQLTHRVASEEKLQ